MAYEKPTCPYCGKAAASGRNVDVKSEQRQTAVCTGCHKRYTIIFGNGRLRTTK